MVRPTKPISIMVCLIIVLIRGIVEELDLCILSEDVIGSLNNIMVSKLPTVYKTPSFPLIVTLIIGNSQLYWKIYYIE